MIHKVVHLFFDFLAAVVLAFVIMIIASLFFSAYAHECLGSAPAVRLAHGIKAWSTWHTIEGQKCWMLGKRHRREVMRHELRGSAKSALSGLSGHETMPPPFVPAAGAIPPATPPEEEDWHGERIAIMPEEDTRLAYWLLGDQWDEFYSACMGQHKSVAPGLTSRWIAAQDASFK